ncbi:hypothetical protein O181_123767 [Austropuccinia psidii MF-1]|uniref:Uncharacterized protein n=1 Tax=Austropuccinia psidii MF-1 TaxID=1389203 RepID=A0A9Q3KNB7_9BASI|nr:hypothetical protein [Austropuccinia psidii MF-1]
MPPCSSCHTTNNSKSRMEGSEDMPNMILSLTQQMQKIQSNHATEIASLQSSFTSSQLPLPCSHSSSSSYEKFVYDLQKFAI